MHLPGRRVDRKRVACSRERGEFVHAAAAAAVIGDDTGPPVEGRSVWLERLGPSSGALLSENSSGCRTAAAHVVLPLSRYRQFR